MQLTGDAREALSRTFARVDRAQAEVSECVVICVPGTDLGIEEGICDLIEVSRHDSETLEASLHLSAAGAQA